MEQLPPFFVLLVVYFLWSSCWLWEFLRINHGWKSDIVRESFLYLLLIEENSLNRHFPAQLIPNLLANRFEEISFAKLPVIENGFRNLVCLQEFVKDV